MKFQKLISLFAFLFLCVLTYAQPWNGATGTFTNPIYRSGNIGVGTTSNPLSPLSVNGDGDSKWSGYFYTPSNTNGSMAIHAVAEQGTGADHIRAISGVVTSGGGYTYGVQGTAYNAISSSAGRAYGVFGQAGNATPGANYGVYARLLGSNGGAALFATDDVNFNDPSGGQYLLGNKTWAGYFRGDMHVSSNVGIRNTNPQSPLSVNGDGDSRWSGYFHSDAATSGSAAIRIEVDQPSGFADQVQAINSTIEAGLGYTYGVRSRAFTNTPSSNGRAYGVYSEAGNATNGANYGVYARLLGSNGGTAILGTDDVNFGDVSGAQYLLGSQTWAGYFIGNTQVTNAMGIGCTNMNQPVGGGSQTYRLFVNGGIAAKALIIQNGGSWCDYVFEKDYELTPLEDVAKHIEEKGHLHKTPSAAEIEANEGFEVGDITLNQQEKIEEIFLHLIEMNNKIESLKAENKALKATLAVQK